MTAQLRQNLGEKSLTVLVTGAASGIGAATVRAFATQGHHVIALDQTQPTMADDARVADVADPNDVRRALEGVTTLDAVVHAAGIGHIGTVEDIDLDELDRLLRVNVRGTVVVCQAALPLLRAAGGGSIVLLGSALGLVGAPNRAAYTATKGAVHALGRQMAVDYVGEGIRVNVICPGTVNTPWVERLLSQADDPESALAALRARQPMGRLGEPEDVAELALFLATERSSFVTGSLISIDGGYTAL